MKYLLNPAVVAESVYEGLQIQVSESHRFEVLILLKVDNLYGTIWTPYNESLCWNCDMTL